MGLKEINQAVLMTPMQENDAGAATIRDYLLALLLGVWNEGEGFDGKRPFGNSSWELEVYFALVSAGHVKGKFDDWGWLEECDEGHANLLIQSAIRSLS